LWNFGGKPKKKEKEANENYNEKYQGNIPYRRMRTRGMRIED
jgi:hypothetical protein